MAHNSVNFSCSLSFNIFSPPANSYKLQLTKLIPRDRRMFPPVRVMFNSTTLNAANEQQTGGHRDKYQVLMDILPHDNKRYRYAYHRSSWQQAGKADPRSPARLFLHPDGPFTLDQLRRQVISFEKIKLTNNDANKHGYVSTKISIFRWTSEHAKCLILIWGFALLLLSSLLMCLCLARVSSCTKLTADN